MTIIKTVCVYCGASSRVESIYQDVAFQTGSLIARAGFQMVYGGGRLGLMGLVADGAIAGGAHVTGVLPTVLLEREGPHPQLSDMHIVDSMHTRKYKMSELADVFVVLPGGFGTLDELFEIITWRQIELHNRPIVIVNTDGYWDGLKTLIHHVIDQRFAQPHHKEFVTFVSTPEEMIALLKPAEETSEEPMISSDIPTSSLPL